MKISAPFSSSSTSTTAVGLYVTSQAVRVTILQQREDAYVVLDCYSRKRGKDFSSSAAESEGLPSSFDDGPPTETSGDDYSIAFGDETGVDGGLPGASSDESGFSFDEPADASDTSGGDTDLAPLLRDILDAAEAQYGSDLEVAFCVGAADVTTELLEAQEGDGTGQSTGRPSKKHLLKRLNAASDQEYARDQVAFLPAASGAEDRSDTLAVIRRNGDAVTGAIQFLHDKSLRSLPMVRLMEAELTWYTDLVREDTDPADDEYTAVLRVGADDTLVMFLEGRQLRYQEYLRSITTLESADTVCSRVLLQQDEAGIDGVDRIVLVTEDREKEFIDRLGEFYPGAEIIPIGDLLARKGLTSGEMDIAEQEGLASWVPAIGVAHRLLTRRGKNDLQSVNLMPPDLRRRKTAVQVAWHTIAMAVVLFLVGFFFTTRYYHQQEEIQELQEEIDQYPASLELTGEQLQARIDSLEAVHETYQNALVRLDTVLSGSDRWSRMLARTVEHSQQVPGLWIEEWHPQGETVNLIGYATQRDRVVRLSNALNATVDRLTSSEIRDYPVFQYSITAPLPGGVPVSVRYLREQHFASISDDPSSIPTP